MSDNQHDGLFRKVVYPSVTDGVINQIISAIKKDALLPGEQLPGENDLAEQLGVSRNALREALNRLIEKGILFRERGVGTFVTPQSGVLLKTNLTDAVGTSVLIANQKKKPGQTGFFFQFEKPPKSVAEFLQIDETEEVLHISRVRTADAKPVIVSEEYIPGNIPGLDYDLSMVEGLGNWSIYDYLQKANYVIQTVITQFHATSADAEMSKKMNIDENAPLLCMEQIHFCNEYNKPILFAVNFHNDRMINMMLVRSI
jgi:GntR family transcriptional regulator